MIYVLLGELAECTYVRTHDVIQMCNWVLFVSYNWVSFAN